MSALRTIVLAKVDMLGSRVTDELVRRDGNWYPVVVPAKRATACVWLNEGTVDDEGKAATYAAKEGYRCFTFPTTEKDPLGRAREMAMAGRTIGGAK